MRPAARAPQGRTLLQLVRAFYSDPGAHQFVYRFNHEQHKFDFNELLRMLGHGKPAAGGGGGGGSGAGGPVAGEK